MREIESKVVPVSRANIDTDVIIPADYLKVVSKDGLGKHLFERMKEHEDFKFFMDENRQDAQILVARENFGCGSSREHAPWALSDWGFRVVIAPNFADIFKNNARKNQILLIEIDVSDVEKILSDASKDSEYGLKIDLPNQVVILPDGTEFQFEIDQYNKMCLIKEIDDLDYLLSKLGEIQEFKRD